MFHFKTMSSERCLVMVGVLLLLVSFAYAAESTKCTHDTCEVRVRIDSGPVCGRMRDAGDGTQYYSFRGIPYGKPPVGARRFQELEPPSSWEEPLYATLEGPACPQKDLVYGHIPLQLKGQSDDCIYANVHVPESAVLNDHDTKCNTTRGLAILVHVHGGAFNVGSGNSDLNGPEYMMLKDVMVVTFNYRLNVFGFLSLNSPKIPGNAGLRDMVTLLRWVQRNARAFGGNPDDVTLMGQSSGAASVHLLSMSKAAEGLFKRIILLSGTGIPNFFATSPAYAKTVADMFVAAAGINSTDPEEIHRQLIDMPLYQIMNANSVVQYNTGLMTFVPVVEKPFENVTRILDDEPISLIGQGREKDIPTLISITTNELQDFRWLMMMVNVLTRVAASPSVLLPTRVALGLSTEEALDLADKVLMRYSNGTLTMDGYISSVNDIFFKYPAFKLVEWRAALGGAPLYFSEYSYESNMNVIKNGFWLEYKSPGHGEDLNFVLHANSILGQNVPYRADSTDDQMKEWMTTLIKNFMHCSNPTCTDDATSAWPPVSESQFQFNNNSQPSIISMTNLTNDYLDMIEFYDSIDTESRNLTQWLSGRDANSDSA